MTALLSNSVRLGALTLSILFLSACSSLTGSPVAVSRTGDTPAPMVVPEGTEPDDVVCPKPVPIWPAGPGTSAAPYI